MVNLKLDFSPYSLQLILLSVTFIFTAPHNQAKSGTATVVPAEESSSVVGQPSSATAALPPPHPGTLCVNSLNLLLPPTPYPSRLFTSQPPPRASPLSSHLPAEHATPPLGPSSSRLRVHHHISFHPPHIPPQLQAQVDQVENKDTGTADLEAEVEKENSGYTVEERRNTRVRMWPHTLRDFVTA